MTPLASTPPVRAGFSHASPFQPPRSPVRAAYGHPRSPATCTANNKSRPGRAGRALYKLRRLSLKAPEMNSRSSSLTTSGGGEGDDTAARHRVAVLPDD